VRENQLRIKSSHPAARTKPPKADPDEAKLATDHPVTNPSNIPD
jgi:hypothetical protein